MRALAQVPQGCCLEQDSRSQFNRLLCRRDSRWFYAFDSLSVEDDDLRRFAAARTEAAIARSSLKALDHTLFCQTEVLCRWRTTDPCRLTSIRRLRRGLLERARNCRRTFAHLPK
jgi:hypothetical protein